jgi:hypothetical protein
VVNYESPRLVTEAVQLPRFDAGDWAAACRAVFAEKHPGLATEVWDDIWEAVPYSYRLWVVAVKRMDRFGTIIIPDTARDSAVACEGWVVSVGNLVCEPDPTMGQRSPYDGALDLVGRRVFWGAYCGVELRPTEMPSNDAPPRNRTYPRQYLSLSIADLMGESLRTGGTIL